MCIFFVANLNTSKLIMQYAFIPRAVLRLIYALYTVKYYLILHISYSITFYFCILIIYPMTIFTALKLLYKWVRKSTSSHLEYKCTWKLYNFNDNIHISILITFAFKSHFSILKTMLLDVFFYYNDSTRSVYLASSKFILITTNYPTKIIFQKNLSPFLLVQMLGTIPALPLTCHPFAYLNLYVILLFKHMYYILYTNITLILYNI